MSGRSLKKVRLLPINKILIGAAAVDVITWDGLIVAAVVCENWFVAGGSVGVEQAARKNPTNEITKPGTNNFLKPKISLLLLSWVYKKCLGDRVLLVPRSMLRTGFQACGGK